MRVLLGSGGFRTDERRAVLAAEMRQLFGEIDHLLFVPYALADHDAYLRLIAERGLDAGFQLDGIHTHPDPKKAILEAEGLFIGGGNTFRLLSELYRLDLLEVIRQRVHKGLPYLGVSAGSNVACPTMQTTNDLPIVCPPSFAALGLVPFQLNPHYFTGATHVKVGDSYLEHFGETRDDRIREYHEMNDTPVVGLWEAGIIRWDGRRGTLIGAAARVFHKGQEPVDWPPGTMFEATQGADGRVTLRQAP
jgi:dipeptidase E